MDSIISDNIPVLTEQEKFNETAISSVQRIAAKLRGEPVPDAPKRADTTRQRTYKTKARVAAETPKTLFCSRRRSGQWSGSAPVIVIRRKITLSSPVHPCWFTSIEATGDEKNRMSDR